MSENIATYQSEFTPSISILDDKTTAALAAKLALLKAGYECGEFHHEIRCYRVPKYLVRKEYALLTQYKQEAFFDLAGIVCDDLCAVLMLMKAVDVHAKVSGDTLHLIAGNISRSVELLRELCRHQADFDSVQVTSFD